MKQTAVDWLFNQLWNIPKDKLTWYSLFEQAKEMEKEQIIDIVEKSRATGLTAEYLLLTYKSQNITLQNQSESKVITELSDEEILKAAKEYDIKSTRWGAKSIFIDAVNWYREQLKNR